MSVGNNLYDGRKACERTQRGPWEDCLSHNNRYLLNHSVSNMILFGGRMILAYNEKIYPYHKWFLKVLEKVERKPHNLMEKAM